jgi:PqqD family protein of HPr-rel-A system
LNAENEREDPVWRLAPGQALRRHGWDGEHLVYNDISGNTHLLTEAALALLLALQQQARPQSALAADLRYAAGAVESLLADLEALSLIECTPC